MNNRKKVESAAMSIRFSGKQELDLHQAIADIVEQTGKSENTVMKYLMQIGLAWYQKGSVVGIDGTVILQNGTEPKSVPVHNLADVKVEQNKPEPPAPVLLHKKNTFLD